MKESRKTVVKPRSEYVMVRTTKELKDRLQAYADGRGLSLSLAGHLAFEAGLETLDARASADKRRGPRGRNDERAQG